MCIVDASKMLPLLPNNCKRHQQGGEHKNERVHNTKRMWGSVQANWTMWGKQVWGNMPKSTDGWGYQGALGIVLMYIYIYIHICTTSHMAPGLLTKYSWLAQLYNRRHKYIL